MVVITFEGETLLADARDTVAAALLGANVGHTRTTPVSGAKRAPFCMMGACFECLVEIDGLANQQACMIRVRAGMAVRRQDGAGRLDP
jgi:predicted molibdopterin-dependent oxidoreductase YjgC